MGKSKNFFELLQKIFCCLSDWCVCVYMLLILVMMPFYNEEGFKHIGTDKSTFFRQCTIYGSKVILPILAIMAVLSMIIFWQKSGLPKWEKRSFQKIAQVCKAQFSVTDGFVLAYGVCVIVSYLCSHYKEEALWGTKGWYMGFIPQLTLVGIYFLVSRVWKRRKWVLATIFPVSTIVFALGYLNRFGIYPIDMELELSAFISTIGNINWYCGYLVSVFFGGLFLLWAVKWEKKWEQVVLMGYVVIGFATLTTQGSNSGIVAAMAIFLVLFYLSAEDGGRMEMFWLEMMLFSLTCLITYLLRVTKVLQSTMIDAVADMLTYSILPVFMTTVSVVFWMAVRKSNQKNAYSKLFFKRMTRICCVGAVGLLVLYIVLLIGNTLAGGAITQWMGLPEDNFLHFTVKWGSNRGATWICAWMCFAEQDWLHKLIGVGPDCLSAFLYDGGSAELIALTKERFGDARLTNAHNEWLTILVDMGMLGFVSYTGMMVSAIRRYLQKRDTCAITATCGICLLAYTVNNMFSFQQSMSVATIFVIFGIGENYARDKKTVAKGNILSTERNKQKR